MVTNQVSGFEARSRWALLLAIPVLAGLEMYFVADTARQRAGLVEHTLQVQLCLQQVVSDLKDAEADQRGYLLTSEERFLEPYRAALARARQELAGLSSLTADNARQQQVLQRLLPLVDAKIAHMEENIASHRVARLSDAERAASIERGKSIMDTILGVADSMRGEEERLLRARELGLTTAASRFYWSLALGYLLIVLTVGSLYRAIGRYGRESAVSQEQLSRLNAELDLRVRERTELLWAREELLNTFVRHVPAAVAMLDREMRYLQVSDRWCSDYSLRIDRTLGRSHYEIFPDLPEGWKQIHQRCLAGETLRADEDCWARADGSSTWLRWEIRPWGDRGGRPEGLLIFSEDISARKRMETSLRNSEQDLRALAGSLLTAQEDERRRIARDLHDDVTQRLAFLSIEIGKLAAGAGLPREQTRQRLHGFQGQILQISQEVRRLSHGLHPSVIEDFGLSTALEEFCEEFGKAEGLQVTFDGPIDDTGLSADGASCLYRIAQESMRNAAKHARATELRVRLAADGAGVQLVVTDNGTGFSAEGNGRVSGLGLVSMKERIRMVNGSLSITSRPGHGTEILASVPFSGVGRETAAHSAG